MKGPDLNRHGPTRLRRTANYLDSKIDADSLLNTVWPKLDDNELIDLVDLLLGKDRKEIATDLGISRAWVSEFIQRVCEKVKATQKELE